MVCDMGVRIQRKACTVVTQHTGHRFYIGAGLQSQGRKCMSQVMEAKISAALWIFLYRRPTASGLHISLVCGDGNGMRPRSLERL